MPKERCPARRISVMKTGGMNRLSRLSHRFSVCGACVVMVDWIIRAPQSIEFARRQAIQSLHFAGRPANDCLLDLRIFAEAEVQATVVLRGEPASAGDFLYLLLAIPIKS